MLLLIHPPFYSLPLQSKKFDTKKDFLIGRLKEKQYLCNHKNVKGNE